MSVTKQHTHGDTFFKIFTCTQTVVKNNQQEHVSDEIRQYSNISNPLILKHLYLPYWYVVNIYSNIIDTIAEYR